MWYSSQAFSAVGASALLDALADAVIAVGPDLSVIAMNRRAQELFKLSPVDGGPPALRDLVGEEEERRLAETARAASASGQEKRLSLSPPGDSVQLFEVRCLPVSELEPAGSMLLVFKDGGDPDHALLLDQLLDTVPDKIYFKDRHSRFIRINRAHARQFGLADPREAVGKTDFDFFSAEHAQAARKEEEEIIRTGKPMIERERKITLANGREAWASTSKLPLFDPKGEIVGTFGISRDITERKDAEAALVEERNLLRTIVDILPSRIFVKDADSHFVLNNKAHLQSLGVHRQEDALGRTTLDFYPERRGEQAMRDDRLVIESGKPIIDQEKSDFGGKGKARWAITTKVPLRDSHGKIIGLVGMSHDITARKNAEEELRLKNEEMEADLKMAREIQQALLTQQFPTFPRSAPAQESALRFFQRYRPASTLAGDFFDVFAVSDTEAGILICDVMGHGVRAALITAFLRGLVEELMEAAGEPGRFLAEVNRNLMQILSQAASPMFATMFYCVADLGRSELRYANAGHPDPLLLRRAARQVQRLAPHKNDPEPALGLVEDFAYGTVTASLAAQDLLLLFTDGIFEVSGPDGTEYGEHRLLAAVADRLDFPPDQLLEGILDEVNRYAAVDDFPDDVCLLAVESTGGWESSASGEVAAQELARVGK